MLLWVIFLVLKLEMLASYQTLRHDSTKGSGARVHDALLDGIAGTR